MMIPLLRFAAAYSVHRSCSYESRCCDVVYFGLSVGGVVGEVVEMSVKHHLHECRSTWFRDSELCSFPLGAYINCAGAVVDECINIHCVLIVIGRWLL